MDLCLIQRVLHLVGEDTSWQARNHLLDFELMRDFEDIWVDGEIVAEESELGWGWVGQGLR